MLKKEISNQLRELKGIEQKENFLRRNGIKFTYDSFYKMIIFADDGILQLFPEGR